MKRTTLKLFTVEFALLGAAMAQESAPAASAQLCNILKSASVQKLTEYIDQAPDDAQAATCVLIAFHQVGIAPAEKALPILVNYLTYKRPRTEGERYGIYKHFPAPDVLYPAIHELVVLGNKSEPTIIDFIASEQANGLALDNALYTLLLIPQGDTLTVIHELHSASLVNRRNSARNRL